MRSVKNQNTWHFLHPSEFLHTQDHHVRINSLYTFENPRIFIKCWIRSRIHSKALRLLLGKRTAWFSWSSILQYQNLIVLILAIAMRKYFDQANRSSIPINWKFYKKNIHTNQSQYKFELSRFIEFWSQQEARNIRLTRKIVRSQWTSINSFLDKIQKQYSTLCHNSFLSAEICYILRTTLSKFLETLFVQKKGWKPSLDLNGIVHVNQSVIRKST